MKKLLLSMFCMLMFGLSALAQDVIVLKDGDLLKTKVVEINKSDVKYKKWENVEGPTYTISITEILAINYQNGTKDNFADHKVEKSDIANSIDIASDNVSKSITSSGKNISQGIDNSVYLSQQKMLSAGKTLKTVGWITLYSCMAAGIAIGGFTDVGIWVGGVGVGVGLLIGCPMIAAGNRKIAAAESVVTTNLYQYNINNDLALSACSFEYLPTNQQCLGVGVSLKF